ncbi:MAG: nicotinamide riboside transporter PnuC [Eubacterium sp.]
MKIRNPFKNLTRFERLLWSCSIIVVMASFVLSDGMNVLTLIASLIGVTALIFVAKGDVWGQILTVLFSVVYGMISFQFRYYGEMITYLGMTMPIAMLSVYTWVKNPYQQTNEVRVHKLGKGQIWLLGISTIFITLVFYYILKAFGTANLFFSTISITTSFSASCLMMFRNQFYALAYAANDIVLIILWVLATIENISYLPMVLCFVMFLINDIYGFFNWKRMELRQNEKLQS